MSKEQGEVLADEIASLIEASIKEADDIRYYSGELRRNASKEALAEKVILAGSIILTALRSPSIDREAVLEEAARVAERYNFGPERTERDNARNSIAQIIAAAIRALKTTPNEPVADWWKPDPDDPFWMLEVRQGFADAGSWLKNEHSQLTTRDPSKALRFPSRQHADYRRQQLGATGSGRFEPTEHLWTRAALGSPEPVVEDRGEAE